MQRAPTKKGKGEGKLMRKTIRICGKRCHSAKGTRCKCFCQGFFHGVDGAGRANREALARGMTELLEQHGFKEGETRYIEQLPLGLS